MAQSFGQENNDDQIRIVPSTRTSRIGRVRTCRSVTAIEWVTIVISALSILVGVGASIYRFATLQWDDPDIVFSILILLNLCFASFYIFHGIFQEQPFEMVTLAITLFLVWILILVNYFSGAVLELKLIRLVISSILTVPNMVLAVVVGWNYWESGRLIFKTVGGEVKFQRFCRQLFFAYSLLVFDVQAQLSCLILALQQGLANITANEIIMLIFGTIYTFVWVSIGYVAMRTENFRLTCLFGISSIVQPAYVIFLFTQAIDVVGLDRKSTVLSAAVYISATSLALSHFTLMATTVLVSHNYEKGLRVKVYGVPLIGDDGEGAESDSLLGRSRAIPESNYDAITPAP